MLFPPWRQKHAARTLLSSLEKIAFTGAERPMIPIPQVQRPALLRQAQYFHEQQGL
jgi:hypothetical protein